MKTVSIILPAYNEAHEIKEKVLELLDYLKELENPKETHSYIKLGDDAKIEYKAKWYK